MWILWKEGGGRGERGIKHIGVHLLRILLRKRGNEGGFTHIRVHLLRILWREGWGGGGFIHIGVYRQKILYREGQGDGHTYQGPSIEDPMQRGKGGSYILGSLY